MKTIYLDFDNTIVDTNKCFTDFLNNQSEDEYLPKMFNNNEDIILDDKYYDFLTFKQGFEQFFNKNNEKYTFIVLINGVKEAVNKKEQWIESHLSDTVKCLNIGNDEFDRGSIDMKDSIYICHDIDCLKNNALINILYNDFDSYDGQYSNINCMVVNTWNEINEILDFYKEYDFKTLDKE